MEASVAHCHFGQNHSGRSTVSMWSFPKSYYPMANFSSQPYLIGNDEWENHAFGSHMT